MKICIYKELWGFKLTEMYEDVGGMASPPGIEPRSKP